MERELLSLFVVGYSARVKGSIESFWFDIMVKYGARRARRYNSVGRILGEETSRSRVEKLPQTQILERRVFKVTTDYAVQYFLDLHSLRDQNKSTTLKRYLPLAPIRARFVKQSASMAGHSGTTPPSQVGTTASFDWLPFSR